MWRKKVKEKAFLVRSSKREGNFTMKLPVLTLFALHMTVAYAQDATTTTTTPAPDHWESRAIFGLHQAGASSAPSTQNYFFDFFIMRGLGKGAEVYDNRFNIWGNVRIASSPQQIDTPIAQYIGEFATRAGELKVNELAQSGEFQTGLGIQLLRMPQCPRTSTGTTCTRDSTNMTRMRTLELVGFWGANGSFNDPSSVGRVFRVPDRISPQWGEFAGRFPQVANNANAKYVGFLPPDRERFYRQYGFGLRVATFEKKRPFAPPATYTVTLGQDQLITEGGYKGAVVRADVFYPLPIGHKDGKFEMLFLFATANLRISKPQNGVPLALERMSNVPLHQNDVAIVAVPSARDTYRIGVGIDFVNLFNSWRNKAKAATAAATGGGNGNTQ